MSRNRFILIFAILMFVGGISYNVYYFKVGKQKKVMKALGRTKAQSQAQTQSSASTPAITATPNQGQDLSQSQLQSDPDRITLPLSGRWLKSGQDETSSLTLSNSNFLPLDQTSLSNLSNLSSALRSNRNPFLTVEEEQMIKRSKSERAQRTQMALKSDNSARINPGGSTNSTNSINSINEVKPKSQAETIKPTPTIVYDVNIERQPSEPTLPNLKVTAIMISGERKVAIIEGRRVSEGSLIGMEKVVEIKSDRVVLQSGKSLRELLLAKNRPAVNLIRKGG